MLPPLSVGEMTLRLYGALNYSQNSAPDLRCVRRGGGWKRTYGVASEALPEETGSNR